jgi:hypothetical protein
MSCKTDSDNTAPKIELLSVSPQLGSGIVCGVIEENNVINLNSTDSLKLELRLTDNKGLSQLKIDIHENFDCHGHKAVSPWQVLNLIDLSGTEQILSLGIPVPTTATAGVYHFQIRLLDESGNEAGGTEAYSIRLLNNADTSAPTAVVNLPIADTFSLNRGDLLNFEIRAEDNNDLGGGRAELIYFTTSGNKIKADTYTFEPGLGAIRVVNLEYLLPTTLTRGDYAFFVRVFDAYGNYVDTASKLVQLN